MRLFIGKRIRLPMVGHVYVGATFRPPRRVIAQVALHPIAALVGFFLGLLMILVALQWAR